MKLLKRFCILLLVVAVLLLFFVGMTNVRASAETPEISVVESEVEEVIDSEEEMQNSSVFEAETSEYFGVVPETSASKWFEEKVQPYLLTLGFAFGGVIFALAFLYKKIKKFFEVFKYIKKVFEDAIALFKKSKEDNEVMQSSNEKWKTEVKAELKAELDRRFSAMEEETHETHEGVKKLLKVDRIVYEDNPSMVSNGTSHKVAEVLNHEET